MAERKSPDTPFTFPWKDKSPRVKGGYSGRNLKDTKAENALKDDRKRERRREDANAAAAIGMRLMATSDALTRVRARMQQEENTRNNKLRKLYPTMK